MSLNTVVFDSDSCNDENVEIHPPIVTRHRVRRQKKGARKRRSVAQIIDLSDSSSNKDNNVDNYNADQSVEPIKIKRRRREKHKSNDEEESPIAEENKIETPIIENEIKETPQIEEKEEIKEIPKIEEKIPKKEFKYISTPSLTEERVSELRRTMDRLPGRALTENLVPYKFLRETKITWKGTRLHFQFNRDNEELFHAKLKGGKTQSIVYISKGNKSHINEANPFATLICDHVSNGYSLVVNNGNPVESKISVSVLFKRGHVQNSPRNCQIEFYDKIEGIEKILKSKAPIIYPNGTWILDLNGRFAMKSIKNVIIIDSSKTEMISLVKDDSNSANVEAHINIDPLFVFAFSISCFLCDL